MDKGVIHVNTMPTIARDDKTVKILPESSFSKGISTRENYKIK